MKPLKIANVLCGNGGAALGFKEAGCEIVYANDSNSVVARAFESNHGLAVDESDVGIIDLDTLPYFDLLLGHIPSKCYNENMHFNPYVFASFTRIITTKRPKIICLETNSEAINSRWYNRDLKGLEDAGYHFIVQVCSEKDHGGCASLRTSLVFIGFLSLDCMKEMPPLRYEIGPVVDELLDFHVASSYYFSENTKASFQRYLLENTPFEHGVYHYLKKNEVDFMKLKEKHEYEAMITKVDAIDFNSSSEQSGFVVRDYKGLRYLTIKELKRIVRLPTTFQFALDTMSDIVPVKMQYNKFRKQIAFTSSPTLFKNIAQQIQQAILKAPARVTE